jgi:hypothetical protein
VKERLLGLLAIAAIAAIVVFVTKTDGTASADSPHAGLQFHLGIDLDNDGDDECTTQASSIASCSMASGRRVAVSLYLDSTGLAGYKSYQAAVSYGNGLEAEDEVTQTWPDCGVADGTLDNGATISFGCHTLPWGQSSTHTGRLAVMFFECTDFLTPPTGDALEIVHGPSTTHLTDAAGAAHAEEAAREGFTIRCPSPTQPAQEPCQNIPGDVTNDHLVNAVDGMFILQFVAGLRSSLPCPANATFQGQTGATAAQLILQFVAGLI